MMMSLILLRNYFSTTNELGEILELSILIIFGLFIYALASYFTGNINFLFKNLKPKNIKK
jgi:hypothetical protein